MRKPVSPSSNPSAQDSSGKESLLEEVHDLDALLKAEYEHDTRVQSKALKKWDDQLEFPDLSDQFQPRFVSEGQARSRQLSPESKSALPSGGILAELQAQSRDLLSKQEQSQQETLRMKGRLDASLRAIFAFLEEFTRQLNILKPAIPRVYSLTSKLELKNLVWQSGRVEYRSDNLHTATAGLESVTLTYKLASNDPPLCLGREGNLVESFHRQLFDYGLPFTIKKILDERKVLKSAEFTIQPEIRVQARWLGHEDGRLRCETNNLERLGRLTWLLPVDAPTDRRLLDEFGFMILGQEHDFPHILKRTPTPPGSGG